MRCIKKQKGFTLIELIVSIGIFSAIVLIGTGAVLSLIASSNKARGIQIALDGMNVAVEEMARNMRAGSKYRCFDAGDAIITCTNPLRVGMTFNPPEGHPTITSDDWWYKFDVTSGQILKRTNNNIPTEYFSVTSSNIFIEDMDFHTYGIGADQKQPKVLITIRGYAKGKADQRVSFNLQSTISQRDLEE